MLAGCIAPILFFLVYFIDPTNPIADAKLDPKNYTCTTSAGVKGAAGKMTCVYTGPWYRKPVLYANGTQKTAGLSYVPLTWNGDGARDTFSTIVGYIVEIFLIGVCYNLLYNTIQIHQTFERYLYALLNIQSYECSGKQLDEFWNLTQQEFIYDNPTL